MAQRAALDRIGEQDCDRAEVRIAAAAIRLGEGCPEEAIELLAPVVERSVESLIPTWAAIHALLFDAAAREETGDRRDAEASLERALDLAEPEGLILPFTIIPVQGCSLDHTASSGLTTTGEDHHQHIRPKAPGRHTCSAWTWTHAR